MSVKRSGQGSIGRDRARSLILASRDSRASSPMLSGVKDGYSRGRELVAKGSSSSIKSAESR